MNPYVDGGTRFSVNEAKKIIAYMQLQVDEILKQRRERKAECKRKRKEKCKKKR